MKHSIKSLICLALVSLLTACGSGSSISLSEGFARGTAIRGFQNSDDFVDPLSFSIKKSTEEVSPEKATKIKITKQEIIIDIVHNYYYSKTYAYNLVAETESSVSTEQWTYLKNDILHIVNGIDKTYTEEVIDPDTDTTFVDARNGYKNLYLGKDSLDNLIAGNPAFPDAVGFLDEAYYNGTDIFSTKKISIKSTGEGSLSVNLKIDKKSSSNKQFNYILETSFDDNLLSDYYYYEILETQYSKNKITVSHQFDRNYPDLSDYTKLDS
ncbi:MAG TPA: hypothetical protein PKO28_04405 [Bacilli bacterium]|nr:hypothetical protein [Bacilli bacterium]HPS18959.1 hypothetical protein [Bacilli bacterium]